ncbi:MAG: glycosyltransferase family 4 protein [Ignavibacterium sp.]|nr:glycosyltransferase family 4 protein [Ignavibacterium sp.]
MKLNIAQVVPYYYPSIGGVQGVAQYIAEGLAKLGHSVDVITAYRDHKGRPPMNVPHFEIVNDVHVYRYKSILNIGHMSYMPDLFIHLLRHKYDVIHYHGYRHPLCDISAIIGKLKNSVTILHSHGPFFHKGEISKLKHFLYNLYDKIASFTTLKLTDKIIVFNQWEIDNFRKLKVDDSKFEMVLNAAEEDSFKTFIPASFIKKHNLEGKKIILCLGIVNESKRQDLLIEALPLIIKEVPEAFLILAGPDGGLMEIVNRKAKDLKVEKYFKHIGPVFGEEKHRAYEAADIFALTSDKDAYPLVIAEAMAHGLPIVATKAKGPLSMIHNGLDGVLVEKQDIINIAQAIIKLLRDEKLRLTISENAKKNALENHNAIKSVEKIEKIYYQLLQ